MKGFIISTGEGTRLKAAFPDVPKILCPIHGEPFLTYLLNLMMSGGIEDVYISTNNENCSAIYEYVEKLTHNGLKCKVYVIKLGKIPFDQSLFELHRLVRNPKHESIFLTCCDNIAPIDFHALEKMLHDNDFDEVIITPKLFKPKGYGIVKLSKNLIITDFIHRYEGNDENFVDGGMSLLRHDFVEKVLSFENNFDGYLSYALKSGKIGAYIPDTWFDIGNISSYQTANRSALFKELFVSYR